MTEGSRAVSLGALAAGSNALIDLDRLRIRLEHLGNMNGTNSNHRSPIVVIRQKELELADRLAAARAAAERAVLEAHRWAADECERAEREGRQTAAAFYQVELDAIDVEAQSVSADGDRVAVQIAERGTHALGPAAQRILAIVLPRLNSE